MAVADQLVTGAGTESALAVVTPPLPPEVEEVRCEYDPAAMDGVPPHVTILYPFLRPDEIDGPTLVRLGQVTGAFDAFDYRLTEVRLFPGEVLFLLVEPSEPFLAVTRAFVDRWPGLLPYRGSVAVADIVPHVTIGHRIPLERRRAVEERLASWLPVTAEATDVSLLVKYGTWSVETVFSLG